MKTIVGLGNPGRRYERTPHNVGFVVVDCLAARLGCSLRRRFRLRAEAGAGEHAGVRILLVKPRTYMNRSGTAVAAVVRYWKLTPADVFVVVDDADLPLGRIRIRRQGGSGGHRGLASVAAALGTNDFGRLRLGIGRSGAGGGLVAHVLSPFTAAEWRVAETVARTAADAVLVWAERGEEAAMNLYNAYGVEGGPEPAGEDRRKA